MSSKRKGRSGMGFNRRRGSSGTNAQATTSDKHACIKGNEGASGWRTGQVTGDGFRKSSSSNSDNGSKSGIRTRRRRRRRMRARQKQEEYGEPRKNIGQRKRKPKMHILNTKETVGCSESSTSGSLLPSPSAAYGLRHSSNFTDSNHTSQIYKYNPRSRKHTLCSNGSTIGCLKLPWANLNLPMDLSHIVLEVKNNDGIDFDLLAKENHQRWRANLLKVQKWTSLRNPQYSMSYLL